MVSVKGKRIDPLRGRILPLRSLSLLLATAALLGGTDRVLAISVLLGGLAFAVPHGWYTWYVLRVQGAQSCPRQIYRRFQRGVMQKLGLTAIVCALVFATVQPLNHAGFFMAFLAMMMLSWVHAARLAHVTDQV